MKFSVSHYYRCPVCLHNVEWKVEEIDCAWVYTIRCCHKGCILYNDEKQMGTMDSVIAEMDKQGRIQNK